MRTTHNTDTDAEQAWAESPQRQVRPDATILSGQDARAYAADLLAEATADDPQGREQVARAAAAGRPSLDPATPGPSPVWSLRVPPTLHEAMTRRAQAEGVTLPVLLRRVAGEYVQRAEAS